jgi:UDP-N-acetylglucosamine enolpyruvyl transferase
MGERFNRFKNDIEREIVDRRAAVEQAPAQFEALKQSLGRFEGESVLGQRFSFLGQRLALGSFIGTAAASKGSFTIKFLKIENAQLTYADFREAGAWPLVPVIENDQFKWRVAAKNNQAFTNDELADEVAVHLAERIRELPNPLPPS